MLNNNKIILDLCGGTGGWSDPYQKAGYDVRIITLPENDVRAFMPPDNVYGILAAPPCTMFSMARTTAKTERDFKGAMDVVYACLRIIWSAQYKDKFNLKFWAIENPAGHLKKFLGNPAYIFHPYEFGDAYSKKTYLWGNFKEPVKKESLFIELSPEQLLASRNNTRKLPEIPEDYQRDDKMKTIQIRRSITPAGFANEFFKYNK